MKIGALLALGFGDAGSKIIANNIARGGDIDPMVAGEKCMGIYGFCDIHHFAEANEVLDVDIMMFVNQIAEVVHAAVNKYGGSPNKNIGEAFVCIWKFRPEDIKRKNGQPCLRKKSKTKHIVADLALFSYLKIIAKINKLDTLVDYSHHEALTRILPGFKVRMGFGLHVGWAIEGAIGSEFKIDASYLSPNMNLAARLEAASRQYGVPILISGELHDLLSPKVSTICREIDMVTVKGSLFPMRLFTVSVIQDGLKRIKDRFADMELREKKENRLLEKQTVLKKLFDF